MGGIATNDVGIGKDGAPKDSFERGMEFRDTQTENKRIITNTVVFKQLVATYLLLHAETPRQGFHLYL